MLNNCDFSKLYLKLHYHFNELKTAKKFYFYRYITTREKNMNWVAPR